MIYDVLFSKSVFLNDCLAWWFLHWQKKRNAPRVKVGSYSSLFRNSISNPFRWRVFGSGLNIYMWINIWTIFIEILFQQKTFSFPFFFISWKRLNTAYKFTKQSNSLRASWSLVLISLQRCWILLQISIEFLRLLLKFWKNFIKYQFK